MPAIPSGSVGYRVRRAGRKQEDGGQRGQAPFHDAAFSGYPRGLAASVRNEAIRARLREKVARRAG